MPELGKLVTCHTFAYLWQGDARAFRWDPAVINWALSVDFYGGNTVIDCLRGKSTSSNIIMLRLLFTRTTELGKHGPLKLDMSEVGIFFPAKSTLRAYMPFIQVHDEIDDPKKVIVVCARVLTLFADCRAEKNVAKESYHLPYGWHQC